MLINVMLMKEEHVLLKSIQHAGFGQEFEEMTFESTTPPPFFFDKRS